MTNSDGKSHSLIVLTKLPNKAAGAVAEAVEERGLAKGKTFERNRFRTQSRQVLSSTLKRIRQAMTKDGSEQRYHSCSCTSIGVMTQGKTRMRQFRTSGSVRGAAREGGSYRDKACPERSEGSFCLFLTDPSKLRMSEARTLNSNPDP